LKQFFTLLGSLITVVLVLAGLIGISYRTFRDDGWMSQGFGKITDVYITYPLMGLGITVALVLALRAWLARRNLGKRGLHFDYIVYVFMGAGIYFIGHYLLRGTL
jgi:phosphate/sulfate permease